MENPASWPEAVKVISSNLAAGAQVVAEALIAKNYINPAITAETLTIMIKVIINDWNQNLNDCCGLSQPMTIYTALKKYNYIVFE